jgi:hypothetical protein
MIINTPEDLKTSSQSPEKTAFLTSLLNDYVVFDDAEYPEDYDRFLTSEDEGYIEPIIRKVWNAGSAASWGFNSREAIESALSQ